MAELKLWEWYLDFGRAGDLSGLFVATQEEVDGAEGKLIYFGEVLGKHSHISEVFSRTFVDPVDVSQEFVQEFNRIWPFGFGINLLDSIE